MATTMISRNIVHKPRRQALATATAIYGPAHEKVEQFATHKSQEGWLLSKADQYGMKKSFATREHDVCTAHAQQESSTPVQPKQLQSIPLCKCVMHQGTNKSRQDANNDDTIV